MAESWQTIEQAAVSLRLSVRTVNRHIVAGKLQSRLSEGRREVLVDTANAPPADGPSAAASPFADGPVPLADAFAAATGRYDTASATTANSNLAQASSNQGGGGAITVDQETVLALADNAAEKAEMAVTAYQALARVADAQAQQVRRNARLAWAAVAVMAAGVTSAVGWATYRGTRLAVEHKQLTDVAAQHAERADKASAEGEALRTQLATKQQELREEMTAKERALQAEVATAREQAARTEGKLAAYIEQEQERQSREEEARAEAASAALAGTPSPSPVLPATQPAPDQSTVAAGDLASADAVGPSPTDTRGGGAVTANANDAEEGAHSEPDAPAGGFAASSSSDETDKTDARQPEAGAETAKADAGRGAGGPDQPRTQARNAKSSAPATRPVAQRRRARAPGARPAPTSDTSSASTADEQ